MTLKRNVEQFKNLRYTIGIRRFLQMPTVLTSRNVYFFLIATIDIASSLIASHYSIFYLDHGITESWLGYLAMVSSLTIVVFEFPTGVIADRYGQSLSIYISLLIRAVTSIVTIFCYGQLFFVLLVFVSSIGQTFSSGSTVAWVFQRDGSIKNDTAKFFSNAAIISNLSKMLGGVVGAVLASLNRSTPFVISGVLFIFLFLFFVAFNKSLKKEKNDAFLVQRRIYKNSIVEDAIESIMFVLKDKTLLLITISGFFFVCFCSIPIIYWQPLFFNYSKSYLNLAWIWASFISMNIAGNYVSKNKFVRKFNPLSLFKFLLFLCGSFLFFTSIFISTVKISLCMFFVYHFFLGILAPVRGSIINDLIIDQKRASVLSFISFTESFGTIFSYFIFGYLCNIFDLNVIFSLSVLPLIVALLVSMRIEVS